MRDSDTYIVLSEIDRSLHADLVTPLIRHGWLVTVASSPETIRNQVLRFGMPALLIGSIKGLQQLEEKLATVLGQPRRIACLAITCSEEEYMKGWPSEEAMSWLKTDDFIVWPAAEAEIILRVERILHVHCLSAGSRSLRVARPGNAILPDSLLQETPWEKRLSATEREIVHRLIEAEGDVVPLEELARFIDAPTLAARVNALRVHITRLRRKIEADPGKPNHIVTVRRVGYRLAEKGNSEAHAS